ncbi:MAG: hypothetical protein KKG47_14765 [Proteobacteria bacterium]|nr:hypothetical protein [Pseudomonadota bacterium]MBU1739846.1 hypothetical protein [Pseudomonadota bacterium]
MKLPFAKIAKKPTFALSGNSELTILAEVISKPGFLEPELKILSSTEGAPGNEVTLHRLLSSVSARKGTVSVALPLYLFKTITVSMPVMLEEAVGKAIPYHLAKALDKPLQDFIYDWQITRRQKDHLEITAYLFPAKVFNTMRSELARKQLELKYLEPDVFAAFSYLTLSGKLSGRETALCSLVWPDHSSHAIYENGQLKLVRSVEGKPPKSPFSLDEEEKTLDKPLPEAEPVDSTESAEADEDPFLVEDDSILSDFLLAPRGGRAPAPAPPVFEQIPNADEFSAENDEDNFSTETFPVEKDHTWPEYINSLGLEMIRTRDYFSSILKGSELNKVFIGGATTFFDNMGEITRSTINAELAPLTEAAGTEECPDLIRAICIGTAAR